MGQEIINLAAHINFQSRTQIWKIKTIFLVKAIRQKFIYNPNICLSDLFYLGIQYTEHVSISYYFLIQYVLSSKNSLNYFTTFGSSVYQESFSWVHTIWHYNLTVAWPTLCHCWGDSQPNVYHCLLFLFDLKVTENHVQQSWISKLGQAPIGVWTGFLPILNVTTFPTRSFSLVSNVYGSLDYSPLVFNGYVVLFLVDFFVF